jgi:hypothetical protein
VSTIRHYPKQMLLPSAVVALVSTLPLLLVVAGAGIGALDLEANGGDLSAESDEALSLLLGAAFTLLLWVLIVAVVSILLTGLLTIVVSRATIGDDITIGEAVRRLRPRLWRLLGTTIAYSLVLLAPWVAATIVVSIGVGLDSGVVITLGALGFLGAIAVTVWLAVRLALAVPAVALESHEDGAPVGPLAALRRSSDLVRGAWWRTLGVLLLGVVLAGAVSALLNLPASLAGAALESALDGSTVAVVWALVLSIVAGVVAQTITAPFMAAVITLTYVDRRIRAERLDQALAAAAGVDLRPDAAA